MFNEEQADHFHLRSDQIDQEAQFQKHTHTPTNILPEQARRVPFAFKDLMIHSRLQFALRFAFRCVLHRCETLEIHWLRFVFYFYVFWFSLNLDFGR